MTVYKFYINLYKTRCAFKRKRTTILKQKIPIITVMVDKHENLRTYVKVLMNKNSHPECQLSELDRNVHTAHK